MSTGMRRILGLAFGLLLIVYFFPSPAVAASALMTGVVGETALACSSVKLDEIVQLLRKADPKGHKLIEQSLRKGDCVEINNGTPVAVLGRDSHRRSSRNNYLIWHSNGKVYSLSENKIVNLSALNQELPVLHPSTIGPSPVTTLPTPPPTPAIKPVSVSGELAPHSVSERPAILDDWWLALNLCFPIGPLPLFSVLVILATHAVSHGFHSLLYPFAATAIAIGIAGGLVGFDIPKPGKRSVVAVLTAYGHAIYLNLAKRAVALRLKEGREGPTEGRREPTIRLRDSRTQHQVISWPRRRWS
jgi:hypothetical protein